MLGLGAGIRGRLLQHCVRDFQLKARTSLAWPGPMCASVTRSGISLLYHLVLAALAVCVSGTASAGFMGIPHLCNKKMWQENVFHFQFYSNTNADLGSWSSRQIAEHTPRRKLSLLSTYYN